MAWERRRNRMYYYRSHRIGKRVVKEYFGAGLAAHLAAAEDDQRRQRREQARDEVEAAHRETGLAADPYQQMDILTTALTKAAFREAGYHQHDRGEWRKRRDIPRD